MPIYPILPRLVSFRLIAVHFYVFCILNLFFNKTSNAQVVSITGAGNNTTCTGWTVINNGVLSPCAAVIPSNYYNLAISENVASTIVFNMNTSSGSGYILLDFDLWMGKNGGSAASTSDYVSIYFNGTAATNEYFRISQISNGN